LSIARQMHTQGATPSFTETRGLPRAQGATPSFTETRDLPRAQGATRIAPCLADVPATYDIVYADPPWPVTDFGTASARRHYQIMAFDELAALPVRQIMNGRAVLFLWATCPRLDMAVDLIRAWGLFYRGVSWVWVKTRADGQIVHGKGVPPTLTKPNVELVLGATTLRRGRPFPILTQAMGQVVLARPTRHSEKPAIFAERIVELCGDRPRIELFARQRRLGWDAWGNEVAANGLSEHKM